MSTVNSQKIQNQSKTVLTVCKVARVFLYIAFAAVIALFVASFFLTPEQAFLGWHLSDGTAITLAEFSPEGAEEFNTADFRIEMVDMLIYLVLSYLMLHQVTKLFTLIQNSENPFTAQIVSVMKIAAILLGIVVGLDNLLAGLVVDFSVYAFAMIFEYGQALQQQADETL